jgi:hypothetical protein
MSWFNISKQLTTQAIGMASGVLLSLAAYSQTDSTKPVPNTFIFSKYQLPTQGNATASTSLFSAPVQASPYKIHYKIKTLTYPADPDPKPKRFNLIDALITGYLDDKNKDENNNFLVTPFKKH